MPPAALSTACSELSLLAQQLDELSGGSSRHKRGRRAAGERAAAQESAAAGERETEECRSRHRDRRYTPSSRLFTDVAARDAVFSGGSSSSSSSADGRWTAAAAVRFFSRGRSRDSSRKTERGRTAASYASPEDLRLVRSATAAAAERCLPSATQLSPCLAPYYSPVLHPFWLTQDHTAAGDFGETEDEEEEEEEDDEFLSSLKHLQSPADAADATAGDGRGLGLRSRSSNRRRRQLFWRRTAARRRRRDKSPRALLQQELPQQSPEAAAAAAAALLSCNSFNSYRIAAVVPPAPGRGTWSDETNLGDLLPLLLPEQYENQREEQQRLQHLLLQLQQRRQLHTTSQDLLLEQQQQLGGHLLPQEEGNALYFSAATRKAEAAAEGTATETAAAGEAEGENGKTLQLPLPTEQLLALLQDRPTPAGRGDGIAGYSSSCLPAGSSGQTTRKEEEEASTPAGAATTDVCDSWKGRGNSSMSRAFVSASFAAAAATAEAEAQRVAAQSPADMLQRRQLKVRFEPQKLLPQDAEPTKTPPAATAAAYPQHLPSGGAAAAAANAVPVPGDAVGGSAAAGAADEGSDGGVSEEFPYTSRTPVAASLAAEAAAAEAAAVEGREAASLSAACDAVGRVKLQQIWGAAAAEQRRRRLLQELQRKEEQQLRLEAEMKAIHGLQEQLDEWQADLTLPQPPRREQQVGGIFLQQEKPFEEQQQQLAEMQQQQQLSEMQQQHQEYAVVLLQQDQQVTMQQQPLLAQQPSLQQQQLSLQQDQLLLTEEELAEQKPPISSSRPGELYLAGTQELLDMVEPQQAATSREFLQKQKKEEEEQQQMGEQQSRCLQQETVCSPTDASLSSAAAVAGPAAVAAESVARARAAAAIVPPQTAIVAREARRAPAVVDGSHTAAAVASIAGRPAAAAAAARAGAGSCVSAGAAAAPASAADVAAAAAASRAAPARRAPQRPRSGPAPLQSSPARRSLAAGRKTGGAARSATTAAGAPVAAAAAGGGGAHPNNMRGSRATSKASAPSPGRTPSLQRSSSSSSLTAATSKRRPHPQPKQQQQKQQHVHQEGQLQTLQQRPVKSEPAAHTAALAAASEADSRAVAATAASQSPAGVTSVSAAGVPLSVPSASPSVHATAAAAADAASAVPAKAIQAPAAAAPSPPPRFASVARPSSAAPAAARAASAAGWVPPAAIPPSGSTLAAAAGSPSPRLKSVAISSSAAAAAPVRAASASVGVSLGDSTASGSAPAAAAVRSAAAVTRSAAVVAAADAVAVPSSAGKPPSLPYSTKLDEAQIARQLHQQTYVEQQVQQVKQQQQQQLLQRQPQHAPPLQQQPQQNRQQKQLQQQQRLPAQPTLQPPSLQQQQQQVYWRKEGKQDTSREQQQQWQQQQQPSRTYTVVRRVDTANNLPQVVSTTVYRRSSEGTSTLAAAGRAAGGVPYAAAVRAAAAHSGRQPAGAPVIREWRIVNGVATPVLAARKTTTHTLAAAAPPPTAPAFGAAAILPAPASGAVRAVTAAPVPVTRAAVKYAGPVAASEPASPKKFSLFEKLRLLLGGGSSSGSCTQCVCASEAPSTTGTSQAGEKERRKQPTPASASSEVFAPLWLLPNQQTPVYVQWPLQHPQQQQRSAQRAVVSQQPKGETGQRPAASSSVAATTDAARFMPMPSCSMLLPAYSAVPTPGASVPTSHDVELHATQCIPQRQQEKRPSNKQLESVGNDEKTWQQQGEKRVFRAPSRLYAVAAPVTAEIPTRRAAAAAVAPETSVYMPAGDVAARPAPLHVLPDQSAAAEAGKMRFVAADGRRKSSRGAVAAFHRDAAAAYTSPSLPPSPTAAAAVYAPVSPRNAAAGAAEPSSFPSAPSPVSMQQQSRWRSDGWAGNESKQGHVPPVSFEALKEEGWQWRPDSLLQSGGVGVLHDSEEQHQLAFQQQLERLRREQGIYRKQTIAELQQQPPLYRGKEVRQEQVPLPARAATPAAEYVHDRYYGTGGAFPPCLAAAESASRDHSLFRRKAGDGGGEGAAATEGRGKGKRKTGAQIEEFEYRSEGEKKRKSKVPENWIRFGADAAAEEDTGAGAPSGIAAEATAASDEVWMSRTPQRQRRRPDDIKREWLRQYPAYQSAVELEQQRVRQEQQQQQHLTAEQELSLTGTSHEEVVQRLLQQRRLLQQQRQRLLKQQRQRSTRERDAEELAAYEEAVALGITEGTLPQHRQEGVEHSRYKEDSGRERLGRRREQLQQQHQQQLLLQQQVHRQQQQQQEQLQQLQQQHYRQQQHQGHEPQELLQQGDEKQRSTEAEGQQRGQRQHGMDDTKSEGSRDGVKDKADHLCATPTAGQQTQRTAASEEHEEAAARVLQRGHQQPGANDDARRSPYSSSRKSSSRQSKADSRDLPALEQPRQEAINISSTSSGAPPAAVLSEDAHPAAAKSPTEAAAIASAVSDTGKTLLLGKAGLTGRPSISSEAAADRSSQARQRSQERAREAQDTAAAAAAAHIAAIAATKAARAADTAIAVLAAASSGTPIDVRTLQQQQKQQQGTLLHKRTDYGRGVPLTGSRQLHDGYTEGDTDDYGEGTMPAAQAGREAYAVAALSRPTEAAADASAAGGLSLEVHQTRSALYVQPHRSFSVCPAAAAVQKNSSAPIATREKKDRKVYGGSVGDPSAVATATAAAAAAAAEAAQEAARRAAANIQEVAAVVADPLRPLQQLFSLCTGRSETVPAREAGESPGVWATARTCPAPTTYYRTYEERPCPSTVRIEQPQEEPLVLRYWYKIPPTEQELGQQETKQLVGEQHQVGSYYTGPPEEPPSVLYQKSAAAPVEFPATKKTEHQYPEASDTRRRHGSTPAARGAAALATTTYECPLYAQ